MHGAGHRASPHVAQLNTNRYLRAHIGPCPEHTDGLQLQIVGIARRIRRTNCHHLVGVSLVRRRNGARDVCTVAIYCNARYPARVHVCTCTRTERRDRVLAKALADWCKTTTHNRDRFWRTLGAVVHANMVGIRHSHTGVRQSVAHDLRARISRSSAIAEER